MALQPDDETALNERQSLIVARVAEEGFVTIEALARDFDVSAQTVRREIIRLDELGFLRRFHGGAGPSGSGTRLPYEAKQSLDADLKQRIGDAMAAQILSAQILSAQVLSAQVMSGQALFLDVGTTAEATAHALVARGAFALPLTIVTPSASIARILSANRGIDVVLTGGRLVGPDLSMAGPIALRTISSYRFDMAVISCSGIDGEGAVLDFDADKIAVKQQAMRFSARKALMADSTKFSRSALMHMADLDDFDLLVTDRMPARSILEILGPDRLVIASPPPKAPEPGPGRD